MWVGEKEGETDLVAALCSPVWQKWKRTSRRVFVKAYLLDILRGGEQVGGRFCEEEGV